MHIVVVNQFFWPDLSGASLLASDLVRELARRGIRVTVITGSSTTGGRNDSEPPNAEIIRLKELPFSRTNLGRVLSSISFFSAALTCLPRVWKANLIMTLTTPPLLPLLGTMLQGLTGCQHVIWEMDMYPDVSIDLGVLLPASLTSRLSGAIIDFSRRHAKCIISLGSCMTRRLVARGTPGLKIRLAENWADGEVYKPASSQKPHCPFTVVYAGNAGLAHDVSTICGAMERLKDDFRFRFSFIGGGTRMQDIREFCESHGVSNASFSDFKPPKRLVTEDFASASVGLVTQNPACVGTVVPSKIYGIMGAGLPFIFIGPRDSAPSLTLARFQCGWQIDCSRVDELVSLLGVLANCPQLVTAAGVRGRRAFLAHFDLPVGVSRICDILGVGEHGSQSISGRSTSFWSRSRATLVRSKEQR